MDTPLTGGWENAVGLVTRGFRCGHCDNSVASERGWQTNTPHNPTGKRTGEIRLCPLCNQPTFFRTPDGIQLPGVRPGAPVKHLTPDVEVLYNEARDCHAANAYTAAVLALRKLLMHIAVEKGAVAGLKFIEYVDYLDQGGYLGRGGKGWVDLIRTRSNEANHEIALMSRDDSHHLMDLAEMLLKLVYEFPGNLPKAGATP